MAVVWKTQVADIEGQGQGLGARTCADSWTELVDLFVVTPSPARVTQLTLGQVQKLSSVVPLVCAVFFRKSSRPNNITLNKVNMCGPQQMENIAYSIYQTYKIIEAW